MTNQMQSPPQTLQDKINHIVLTTNKADGWNATEMAAELQKRGWMPEMHTVIDIADVMREMWGRPPRQDEKIR